MRPGPDAARPAPRAAAAWAAAGAPAAAPRLCHQASCQPPADLGPQARLSAQGSPRAALATAAAALGAGGAGRRGGRRGLQRGAAPLARPAAAAGGVATLAPVAWPPEVAGYACRGVVAEVPGLGPLGALVVDDGAGADKVEEDLPDWVPKEWLSPVIGDDSVGDIYGAIGVWPAAFVASEELRGWAQGARGPPAAGWRCVEVGSGAGFPSLMAARLGASALAIDTEELPLALLREAFVAQCLAGRMPADATLVARRGDAREAPLQDADAIVVSDLLYSAELARAVGTQLGQAARRGQHVVVTCGGRSGRAAFVEAFSEALGSPCSFVDTPVPAWATERRDLFDGGATTAVGVLRY